jgi:hypothetical protein
LVQEFEEAVICATELGFCSRVDHFVYSYGHIGFPRLARGLEQSICSVCPINFQYSASFERPLVFCFLQTSITSWWTRNNCVSLDSYFSDHTKFSQYFAVGSTTVGALHFVVEFCSVPKLLDIGSK